MADSGTRSRPRESSVVVVGGGLTGLELARQLELLGVTGVTLLEAGPAGDLRHINTSQDTKNAARTWLESAADSHFHRPWTSLTPPHYTKTSGIRRRLGGRSLYWAGVILPIEPWALASWPDEVVSDLCDSWNGGAPLYTRLNEQLCSVSPHDRSQPPLLDGLTTTVAGLDLQTTPVAIRESSGDPGRWHAYSPLDAWRDPATGQLNRQPTGCRIVPGVEVLHVRQSGGECAGLIVRDTGTGAVTEMDAPLVVLAAGTMENSRLAVQVLSERGVLDEPRLGGLVDHIVQGFFVRFGGSRADRLLRRIPPGNYYAPCGMRNNLFVEVVPIHGGVLLDVRLSGEQLASDESFLECLPGATFPWAYRIHTGLSAADRKVIDSQRELLRRIWRDLAASIGGKNVGLEFDDFNGAHYTNAVVLPEHLCQTVPGSPVTWASYLGTEDHEAGTLPLGDVLNVRHEFIGVQGLFAAGPATFARAGAANPALTALALAHRLAAELATRVRQPSRGMS